MFCRITSSPHRDGVPLIDILANDSNANSNTVIPISANDDQSNDRAAHLRAKLRFFYMSPCWKWHLKRQFPWKAWFQFLKIIIVTTQVNQTLYVLVLLFSSLSLFQLILFGIDRETHVIFISESNITFHHLFVRDWTLAEETLPYPRAAGDFAVFTNYDLIDSINYAVHRVDRFFLELFLEICLAFSSSLII